MYVMWHFEIKTLFVADFLSRTSLPMVHLFQSILQLSLHKGSDTFEG